MSDSDDMDTQTTSSHAESGDTVVCNDETAATESAEGGLPSASLEMKEASGQNVRLMCRRS